MSCPYDTIEIVIMKTDYEDLNCFDLFVLTQLRMQFRLPEFKPGSSKMDCRGIGFEDMNSFMWLSHKDSISALPY
jgi:hypothetical protein